MKNKLGEQNQILYPSAIAVLFLIVAIFPLREYGFYTLLRLAVCVIAIYMAYYSSRAEKIYWVWIMGITALVFNPLVPLHFKKETWVFIDVLAAVVFFIGFFILKQKNTRK